MRVDRTAKFAQEMTPALADVAGKSIHRLGKVDPKRRQVVIDALFKTFKARETGTVGRLMVEMFSPVTPWSEEAAVSGVLLLYDAFCDALESESIWDRRQSSRAIADFVASNMYEHIRTFAEDRGMYRDLHDPIDIGFGGITLEGSR